MQVSVEKVSPVERRLTITVPAQRVEEAYTKQINEVAQKANIKGFRPGKAPLSHIQKQFGDMARKEALSEVIQHALYEAIKEQKLVPISTPQVEPKLGGENDPLEFTASFEVLPEIADVKVAMDNVEKPVVAVQDEDVARVLEQLQKQFTEWKEVTRAAQLSDRIVLDYEATYEGQGDVDNKVADFPLELGSKSMLPGFEEGLIGAQVGDERTLALHFPEDFHDKDKAGKPISFQVKVKRLFEANAPVMDEAFVKRLGVNAGSVDELRTQIKQSLEQERDRLVRDKLKEQVFAQLIEQNPLDVPKSLIEREAKSIHDEVYPQHQAHDHHGHTEDEINTFNDIAKKRVALGLLIAEFTKQHQLKVDQRRVEKRIAEIAAAYEKPEEVITYLSAPERRNGVEAQIMEDQVLDKLIEGLKVTDKSMSYAELKGIQL